MSIVPTALDPIVVSGVAVVCALGHTAPIAFTSVKAGLARIGESAELTIEDFKQRRLGVKCAAVEGVTDGQRRFLRMYRLAVRAFAEVLSHARIDAATLATLPLYLALAESDRPGFDERCRTLLARRIAAALDIADLTPRTIVFEAGHAGALLALEQAAEAVRQGRSDCAIIGGIDSYLDELSLQWLYDLGRLKTDDNPKGFIPGEGASFIVIERESNALRRQAGRYACVAGEGSSFEENGYYEKKPCTGEGLTRAIRSVKDKAGAKADPVSMVLCDLNGERHRAGEWGLAMARCFQDAPTPGIVWHPADAIGDTGAASAAINLSFATLALARGNAGPRTLVWGSSDDGERGAAILARHPMAPPRAQDPAWA